MLSKIIGELAVASLGPGASDLEKKNARTKSETSLKNNLDLYASQGGKP
jgi:hypothetical protein